MLDQMIGLFMPFFADNNWLKGCDKIQMDLNCMYPLFFLIVSIFLTKLKVSIHYFHFQDDDSLKIECKAWLGLIKYKLNIPLIKVDDNSPTIVIKEEVQSDTTEETKRIRFNFLLKIF